MYWCPAHWAHVSSPSDTALALIGSLAPQGRPFPVRVPLEPDECEWFMRGVETGVVQFENSPEDCYRLRKWGIHRPSARGQRRGLSR